MSNRLIALCVTEVSSGSGCTRIGASSNVGTARPPGDRASQNGQLGSVSGTVLPQRRQGMSAGGGTAAGVGSNLSDNGSDGTNSLGAIASKLRSELGFTPSEPELIRQIPRC